jgi:hypothetical protein
MAKVRALCICFVDNGLREEGAEFDYEGPHNTNLEYLDGDEDKPAAKAPRKPGPKPRQAAEFAGAGAD